MLQEGKKKKESCRILQEQSKSIEVLIEEVYDELNNVHR
jgi:hypothetical protein